MDLILTETIVVSVELILVTIELLILIVILAHMKSIGLEGRLLKENIAELRTLHMELHESIRLLKEDIADLDLNNTELQEFIQECKIREGKG